MYLGSSPVTLSATALPKRGIRRRESPAVAADIFGDRAGDIGLAAILPIALIGIEDGVGADPVVTHIVAGHRRVLT